jgi:hypothetical protein
MNSKIFIIGNETEGQKPCFSGLAKAITCP